MEHRKFTVAQLGARMHYAVPRILNTEALLEIFYTDTYANASAGIPAIIARSPLLRNSSLRDRQLGRVAQGIPDGAVRQFPTFSMCYKIARELAHKPQSADLMFSIANYIFGKLVSRGGFGNSRAVYAFNSASLEIFQCARRCGLQRVLEQTMAPFAVHDDILNKVSVDWPGWSRWTSRASHPRLAAREFLEWELADLILCPSEFVVESIGVAGGPTEKCVVVPYGFSSEQRHQSSARPPGPLRLLFCGEVGLRKGAPYLLEALLRLDPRSVDARFVGALAIERDLLSKYAEVATFLGHIPKAAVAQQFRWCDVLMLPSLCEGSATVIYEALAYGKRVVCTPNAGAPPSPNVTAVKEADISALADAISALASMHLPLTNASELFDLSMHGYGIRLMNAIRSRLVN